jgi:hypothetical protein
VVQLDTTPLSSGYAPIIAIVLYGLVLYTIKR